MGNTQENFTIQEIYSYLENFKGNDILQNQSKENLNIVKIIKFISEMSAEEKYGPIINSHGDAILIEKNNEDEYLISPPYANQ